MFTKLIGAMAHGTAYAGTKMVDLLKGNDTPTNPGVKAIWAANTIAGAAAARAPKGPKYTPERIKEIRAAAEKLGLEIPKDVKDW